MISLRDAQDFFVYGDRLSEVAVLATAADRAPALAGRLRRALEGSAVEVHTWEEVIPELRQFVLLDDAGMYLLLSILVIVVGFGILNTILMAVLERRRELGVWIALGLAPRKVFRLVYLESMLLAAVGLILGLAVGIPLVLYFAAHPVHLRGAAASSSSASRGAISGATRGARPSPWRPWRSGSPALCSPWRSTTGWSCKWWKTPSPSKSAICRSTGPASRATRAFAYG